MAAFDSHKVQSALQALLPDIDDDTLAYFVSMIEDSGYEDREALTDTLAPFIESYGLSSDLEAAETLCNQLCDQLKELGVAEHVKEDDNPKLLDRTFILNDIADKHLTDAEKANVEDLWGFESIRNKRNEIMDITEAGSAKYERKAMKEQKKWLDDLENSLKDGADEAKQISTMTLPDLSGSNRERDINVHNFNISFAGQLLLDSAELRLAFGRRYGLVGRNGIGKTTLLRHMATFDIEGFPRHHRVLHVKQEVQASELSVLSAVLEADVERNQLMQREKEIAELQKALPDNAEAATLQPLLDEAQLVQERLVSIGAASAEARAASILSGLQFSDEMQHATTASLSGGWRMRVALAGALFIEPDLLMLDEPTNHLDLEAVLWLSNYLKGYPHTVLLVSHDRAFLNDVCTDMVLFHNQKLIYYKGDYDNYVGTRREIESMQQKQHEAQAIKIGHMQEFVDKFRFNAKRAALVQSRIKAIEKETVIEAVEKEAEFVFHFVDAGPLGRPVIQIEGVTFGYSREVPPLFENIHLNIDQSSRVALVGPNGAGKSTLLNLIQGKLRALDGSIKINPNLRLGIFTQHHMDSFDLRLSALQNMAKQWPLVGEAELRAHLGRYEIQGNDAVKPMKFTSGGQKSRVAFATLTYCKPHVVILDEPTNHLDMRAIEALTQALKVFTGGVVVISHDQHFISHLCTEIWMIKDKKVTGFHGNFDDYKKIVLDGILKRNEKTRRK